MPIKRESIHFLLLATLVIGIILMDIPVFGVGRSPVGLQNIFAGEVQVGISDGRSQDRYFTGRLPDPTENFSPCGLSPRLAILLFKPFDLNRADAETLSFIRGIGPRLATRIITRRKKTGDYKHLRDTLAIRGVGRAKLHSLQEGALICR